MKLVHGLTGRVLDDGALLQTADGETVLVASSRIFTPLEASDEKIVLLDATDGERQELIEAGYALPSEVVQLREDDDGA